MYVLKHGYSTDYAKYIFYRFALLLQSTTGMLISYKIFTSK